jgi:hypothetical protein
MFGRGICEKYQSRDDKFPESNGEGNLFSRLVFFHVQLHGMYDWCFYLMHLRISYYPLANEVATGYSNATVCPSFRPSFLPSVRPSCSYIAINSLVTTRPYYHQYISSALLYTNISCLGGVFAKNTSRETSSDTTFSHMYFIFRLYGISLFSFNVFI